MFYTLVTTQLDKEYNTKRIYINGQETKFHLLDGGVFLRLHKYNVPQCIIRKKNNSLALKAFKKSLGFTEGK